MSRTAQTILVIAIALTVGILASVALGAAKANGRVIAEMRQELARMARQATDDAIADSDHLQKLVDQKRHIEVLQQSLDDLHGKVDGLLMRKPPKTVEFDWSYRFNRIEQRMGNAEYALWGLKK